jgi:hydrogenase maturation protease
MSNVKIIGIGNEFRGDDASGILIARKLKKDFPTLDIIEFSESELNLIDHFKDVDLLILIDAIDDQNGEVGSVKKYSLNQNSEIASLNFYSSHTFSLSDVINLAKQIDLLPERIIIFGIVSSNFQMGSNISFDIEKIYPEIKKEIQTILSQF